LDERGERPHEEHVIYLRNAAWWSGQPRRLTHVRGTPTERAF
jgi:hypothetical protein